MLHDYTLTAKTRILQFCIAQQPGMGLTVNDIELSLPTPARIDNKNTRVTVSYPGSFIDIPTRVLHYNRFDLLTFFRDQFGDSLQLNVAALTESVEALPAILEQFGIAFDEDEIQSQTIVGNSITLKVKPTSLGWTGSVTFSTGESNFQLDDGEPFQLDDGSFFELD